MNKAVISCCLVLALFSTSYATIIGDWEGSLDGWQVSNPYSFSTVGVTHGNYSLRLETPQSWWDQAMIIDLAQIDGGREAFFGHNTVSIDLSFLSAEWVDAGTGWNSDPTVGLILNPSDTHDETNWYDLGARSYDIATLGDGTFTASWDYQFPTSGTIDPDTTEIKLMLYFNFSQYVEPGIFYLDNASLTGAPYAFWIPEPASMSLLGLGALALRSMAKSRFSGLRRKR